MPDLLAPCLINTIPYRFAIDVPGKPVSQGSLHAFVSKSTKKVVSPTPKKLVAWRTEIGYYAMQTMRDLGLTMVKDKPVIVGAGFFFERPALHFRTGKYEHLLRDNYPKNRDHIQYPDLDKCLRAVFDALTGIANADDAQVNTLGDVYKGWTDGAAHAVIKVGW